MKEEEAGVLALRILAVLSENEDALSGFLDEAGLDARELAARAAEGDLLGAVLDFVLGREALLLDLCGQLGVKPHEVVRARAALPGGIGDWA